MTLYLVGLGVYKTPMIPQEWFKKIVRSKYIFFEGYTSPTPYDIQDVRKFFGRRDIKPINRETLEMKIEEIVRIAIEDNVSILVYGDPLIATTHKTLIIQSREMGVDYEILHNVSSYLYAISESGLDIYKIGPVGTLIRGDVDINRSTLDKVRYNLYHGFHSPILLEYSAEENYIMHPSEAIQILREDDKLWKIISDNKSYIIVLMALGFEEENKLAYRPWEIEKMKFLPMGYPSIIIITGKLHFMEREYIEKILRGKT